MFITVNAKLISKEELRTQVYELIFDLDKSLPFIPGQYANLKVSENQWRSYSIVGLEATKMKFIIDTSPGGVASHYFEAIKVGDITKCIYPLGIFQLKPNQKPKLFICTGSGIAPFIPMINSLPHSLASQSILLWGSRSELRPFIDRYIPDNRLKSKYLCISNPTPEFTGFKGRVTDALKQLQLIDNQYDYYICGGLELVNDVAELLREANITDINYEQY
ncbi:MAG: hypothetical protein Fur003_6360 [Candidatus Dojkabacteria bacterium]